MLPVRWALRGEVPGHSSGFKILSNSGGGSESEFSKALWRLVPGTPRRGAKPRDRDALPWISFGGTRGADGRWRLAVLVTEWPQVEILDGAGRSTSVNRYYDVEFALAAGAGVGFAGIYGSVGALSLPMEEAMPAVPAATVDIASVAGQVEQLDWRWCAATAALLLEGPVVIVGKVPVDARRRVETLDAVASLLPYGFRAELTVSTWVPAASDHQIRLAFGDDAGPGRRAVMWGKTLQLPESAGTATAYFERVSSLVHRWGLSKLLERLWGMTGEMSFSDFGAALRALSTLDRPYLAAEAVKAGRGDLGEIRELLMQRAIDPADEDVHDTLLTFVVARGTIQDLAILRPLWRSGRLQHVLARHAIGADTDDRLGACVNLALAADDAEGFFTEITRLATEPNPGPDRQARRRNAIAMLQLIAVPEAGAWPRLQKALLTDRQLCSSLVTQLGERSSGMTDWIDWLSTGQPRRGTGWLRVFWAAAAGTAPADPADVAELGSLGLSACCGALAVAKRHHSLHMVIDALWPQVYHLRPKANDRQVVKLVETLRGASMPEAAQQAKVDVLLLRYGAGPTRLPSDSAATTWQPYAQGFARCVSEVGAGREPLVESFVDAMLAGNALRATQRDINRVVLLADVAVAVKAFALDRNVLRRVAQACAGPGSAILPHLPQTTQDLLIDFSKDLRRLRCLAGLRHAALTGSDAEEIALEWHRLIDEGGTAVEAARMLGEVWPRRHRWQEAKALLDALLSVGSRTGGAERALDRYCDGARAIVDGHLGPVAAEFRREMEAMAGWERRRWERLEKVLRKGWGWAWR